MPSRAYIPKMEIVESEGVFHRKLTVDGVCLHYVEAGQGEPVLLIPGWPQTWYAWRHIVPIFVAEGRRVIVLDARGQGESDKPAHGYDLDTLAAEVHSFLVQLGLVGASSLDVVSTHKLRSASGKRPQRWHRDFFA